MEPPVHSARTDVVIRPANRSDVLELSALAYANQHLLVDDPTERDAGRFLATLSPEAMADRLASDRYATIVASAGLRIVGYLTMRGDHLYHLFVEVDGHRQGVGRRLWEHVSSSGVEKVTVNSSLYAEGFYRRMGFELAGERNTSIPPHVQMVWRRR